jgi:hypothetical protein
MMRSRRTVLAADTSIGVLDGSAVPDPMISPTPAYPVAAAHRATASA